MLSLPLDWTRFETILCLGAHCDDIEIGCGGFLQLLRNRNPEVAVHWVIMAADDTREAESRAAATALLPEPKGLSVDARRFRASYLPQRWAEVKDVFEELKSAWRPDLVLTHRLEDMHQDHRLVAELTWNTFRDHLILEYEIPKFEGDLGSPNVYVPLPEDMARRKVDVLIDCFPSQRARPWFRPGLFLGLMQLRGIECNAPSGYAEAFHARKLAL